ncbi:hypothetical protein MLD38_019649 [Melastoma candidum]|uniref:Uncharacterized protein n=1 Tax=Melastoma candidum TaxID=119954 RepID=A0ACB9QYR9_9MYRT|nr:hypothetical protein MLD38_019649 [Melastoma candidum]
MVSAAEAASLTSFRRRVGIRGRNSEEATVDDLRRADVCFSNVTSLAALDKFVGKLGVQIDVVVSCLESRMVVVNDSLRIDYQTKRNDLLVGRKFGSSGIPEGETEVVRLHLKQRKGQPGILTPLQQGEMLFRLLGKKPKFFKKCLLVSWILQSEFWISWQRDGMAGQALDKQTIF